MCCGWNDHTSVCYLPKIHVVDSNKVDYCLLFNLIISSINLWRKSERFFETEHFAFQYYLVGMATCADDAIANVSGALQQRGMWNNTVFTFSSGKFLTLYENLKEFYVLSLFWSLFQSCGPIDWWRWITWLCALFPKQIKDHCLNVQINNNKVGKETWWTLRIYNYTSHSHKFCSLVSRLFNNYY